MVARTLDMELRTLGVEPSCIKPNQTNDANPMTFAAELSDEETFVTKMEQKWQNL